MLTPALGQAPPHTPGRGVRCERLLGAEAQAPGQTWTATPLPTQTHERANAAHSTGRSVYTLR